MQNVFLDSYGLALKASTRTYRQNASDYRSGHVMQALSVLDTFERLRARNESEMLRLVNASALSKYASGHRYHGKSLSRRTPAFTPGRMLSWRPAHSSRKILALASLDAFPKRNWLRRSTTAAQLGTVAATLKQHLYFEPLTCPTGKRRMRCCGSEIGFVAQVSREFSKRFLNIANPWTDERLKNWNGYS